MSPNFLNAFYHSHEEKFRKIINFYTFNGGTNFKFVPFGAVNLTNILFADHLNDFWNGVLEEYISISKL